MYTRVLVKISGEALSKDGKGIDIQRANEVVLQIKELIKNGISVAVLVGGGNFWRGINTDSISRVTSDYMGMLATVMNCLALSDIMEQHNLETRIQTSLDIEKIALPYNIQTSREAMRQSTVVIFAAGTGSPFYTTDTAAVMKAIEMDCDAILLAKNVDALYTKDPVKYPDAKKISKISYDEVITKNLHALDLTAVTLAKTNNIPIKLFGLKEKNSILRATKGEDFGTTISSEK